MVTAERDVTGEVAIDPTRVIEKITQQLLAANPELSGFDVHGQVSNDGDLSIEVTGTPGISFETGLTVQYTDPVTGELETIDADVVELTAAVEGVDAASVTVDLVNQAATGSATGNDTLIGIENATTGFGDDTLTGDAGVNVLDGGAGDDAIDGGAGDDVLTGNLGSDTIEGGAGADIAVFDGNLENYTFASSADGLTVTVTDTETGDADTITGVETLRFDDADIGVSLNTTDNRMVLTGTSAADTITVVGDVGIEIPGTDGADILTGDLGDDVFAGGADADDIVGGAGDDTIDGDAGDDILAGVAGDDTIDGGAARYSGVYGQVDYTFESSADSQHNHRHVSTSDVDTVTNVETLRFDDGDIGVSADTNGLVLTGSAGIDNITIVGSVAAVLARPKPTFSRAAQAMTSSKAAPVMMLLPVVPATTCSRVTRETTRLSAVPVRIRPSLMGIGRISRFP